MGLKGGYCIFVEGTGEGLGMGTGGEGVSKMGGGRGAATGFWKVGA